MLIRRTASSGYDESAARTRFSTKTTTGRIIDMKCFHIAFWVIAAICLSGTVALAQKPTQAPPGMFKDLDDAILEDALIIRGKQLFIDDFLIDEVRGVQKSLHQPVKHPKNPVLIRDQLWEEAGPGFGTVIYDKEDRLFKLWYEVAGQAGGPEKISVNRPAMRLPKMESTGRNRSSMSSGTQTS